VRQKAKHKGEREQERKRGETGEIQEKQEGRNIVKKGRNRGGGEETEVKT
jgi:hypothetical protein